MKHQHFDRDNSLLEKVRRFAIINSVGPNDTSFLERVYCDGLGKYTSRLQSLGFSNMTNVLDAGCGYGQWSLSLSRLNSSVESCDISPVRINLLKMLCNDFNISNVNPLISGIDLTPYPDNFFDGVFCYGVIFLTPWHKSLAEFKRIIRPGGKLYVNANDLAWYMFLWNEEHNKAIDYDPKQVAASSLVDTLIYDRENTFRPGMNLIIEPNSLKAELNHLGFVDVSIASEGNLHLNKDYSKPTPFFKGQYYGNPCVYEVIATKH